MNFMEIMALINAGVLLLAIIVLLILVVRKGKEERRLQHNVKIKKLQLNEAMLDDRLAQGGEPTLSELVNTGQIVPAGQAVPDKPDEKDEGRKVIKGFSKKEKKDES